MPFPINNQCNFKCSFCDKQWVDPDSLTEEDILQHAPMSELGGLRVVLGGGEPTLHPRLPQLIKGLKQQKVRKIGIRTNGAWASKEGLVRILKKNGLSDAIVLFPTLDEELFNQLVGKKQAYQTVIKGIQNLQKERINIILRIPLLKPTLKDLPALLDALPHVIGRIKRVDLVYLDMKDPDLQIRLDDINTILPFGSQHPNANLPPIYLDPGPGIPMCWVEKMKQWNITPDCPTSKGSKTEKCDSCFVKKGCSGIPKGHLALFGDDDFQAFASPIIESYTPHQELSEMKEINFEKKKGMTYECLESEETTLASVRLRVGHECNRRCEFCFIPHHEKAVQDYDIEKSIESAVALGVRELVMTGGEPTLQNDLPVYIQKASDLGVRRIILQTNGVRLANPEYSQKLVDAGLTSVIISLHSHKADILAQITKLPNAMNRILKGIDNLHKTGVQVSLTHVIGPRNYHLLPEFARFMVEKAKVNRFCFIFATPMSWQMATKDIVVRFSDAAPYLMEAMDYCIEQGVLVDGLAFKCGAPHCVINGEPKYLVDAELIPENNRSEDWIRVPACETCVLKKQCYGVRRFYAWLYGVDEFKPVLDEQKAIEHWSPTAVSLPSRSGIFPHKITPKQYPEDDVKDQVIRRLQQLGERQNIPKKELNLFLNQYEKTTLNDGGFQIIHQYKGASSINIGSIASAGNISSAKSQALLRSLRSLAFNIPISGSHSFWTSTPLPIQEYAESFSKKHLSLLTPHTSYSPAPLNLPQVKTLRTYEFCKEQKCHMSSVDSAVILAQIALDHLNLNRHNLRYNIWGYGKAGQAFARKFDLITVFNSKNHPLRPKLIGCADSKSSWIDINGLEHERITSFKLRNNRLPSGSQDRPEQVLFEEAELVLLSGKGCPINKDNIDNIRSKIIMDMTGSLTPDIEEALKKRGVLCIPSVITTSGPFLLSILELAEKSPEQLKERRLSSLDINPAASFRKRFLNYAKQEYQSLFSSLLQISEQQSLSFLESFLFLALKNWSIKASMENDEKFQSVE